MNILGICGSLRADSLNHQLLKRASTTLEALDASVARFDIGTVPHYNGDLDSDSPPPGVTAFKKALGDADAILIVTPEYNYGVPGVLKNAIDWASRPAFKSPLAGKPAGVLSASMSTMGGARAQAQLRAVLFGTLTPVYAAPEFLLAAAHKAFGDDGKLLDAATQTRLERYLRGFVDWAQRPLTAENA